MRGGVQNQVEDQHEPITTRVLIIDDAAAVRRALGYALGIHEAIEVLATAPDGLAGIEAIEADRPDVVLLDLEMPVLDGLSALAVIRQRWPDLPVVVFSTTTRRGTDATARALTSGAAAALNVTKTCG